MIDVSKQVNDENAMIGGMISCSYCTSPQRLQWLQVLFILFTRAIDVDSIITPTVRPRSLESWRSISSQRRNMQLSGTTTTVTSTEQLLRDHGFGQRIITLSSNDLPVTAELHDHGAWNLCRVVSLEPPKKGSSHPRLRVQVQEEIRVVELGQITTVWNWNGPQHDQNFQQHVHSFSMKQYEKAMQDLYVKFSRRPSHSKGTMNKKIISKIIQQTNHGQDQEHVEGILKKIVKAGDRMHRLVDSAIAMEYLYAQGSCNTDLEPSLRRSVGGFAIAQDSLLGGRFKRMPCVYISACHGNENNVDSITFVNGGWLVVDPNVRSNAEARKFVERMKDGGYRSLTAADGRIAHRLECLAMGEVFCAKIEELELEVDVREALKALDLPTTPQGAREALVRIGLWSEDQTRGKFEPWSDETLHAAKEYARADGIRRNLLSKIHEENNDVDLEGRIDLTSLPAICIDAETTTFRDDAIGIRPRSMTGRKVVPQASNWELLIHIADASDIYCPQQRFLDGRKVELLRAAAVLRSMSRYDLPSGPLHLLPPVVLKSLSFTTHPPGSIIDSKVPNRCVSLWAYIDERSGKILECGLERTLIAPPLALTYESASKCLHDRATLAKDDPMYKASSILALAERNLQLWSDEYKKSSEAARKREERLAVKQVISQHSSKTFERSRGYRLVDGALDLYGVALTQLLREKNAPIPRASGSGSARMGRVATAPLRRYIDGMAQRQALSVLCHYGGPPLTIEECQQVNAQTNDAMNRLANLRPLKHKDEGRRQQQMALAQLERKRHFVLQAMSTGRGNEVSIDGALGQCRGIEGSLCAGQTMSVRVQTIQVDKGLLIVELVQ